MLHDGQECVDSFWSLRKYDEQGLCPLTNEVSGLQLTRLQQTKDDVALYVLQAAREVKQKLTAKPEVCFLAHSLFLPQAYFFSSRAVVGFHNMGSSNSLL